MAQQKNTTKVEEPTAPVAPTTPDTPTAAVPEPSGKLDDAFIKQALLKGAYASEGDITKAEAYVKSHHAPLTEYLFNEELLNKELLAHAIAEALGVPYIDLSTSGLQKEVVTKLPKEFSESHKTVLISLSDTEAKVATAMLDMEALKKDLGVVLPGKKITIGFAFEGEMSHAMSLYKEALEARFTEIIKREQKVAPEIVEQIVEDAVLLRASDVHLEPQETEVLVRFRIDGVLEEAGTLPKQHYENVINRIKIEAHLRIDEHMRSQDGAIRYRSEQTKADLRVSIIPTVSGEKVVMRILGEYLKGLTLSDIGLSNHHQALITEVANRPYGMILTVGPTGSGKTTTLYALLRMLNDSSVNVTTIEDPVEYRIPRLNQVQVNEATGLTFANGLRTVVRQDPDVILVGEIRDLETAETSINAALTGHLLLSTFHANDSATAIPRLLDMKVEPFLLASTLSVIVAQRLIRKICTHCKVSETVSVASLVETYPKLRPFLEGSELVVYHGKGCQKCNNTGYKGQMGIFEFMEVSPRLEDAIMRDPSSETLSRIAREEGTRSFFEDGLQKVLAGTTTFEELLRVALPPKYLSEKTSPMPEGSGASTPKPTKKRTEAAGT